MGPDHPDVAETLSNFALSLNANGKAAAAEPLTRRSVDILVKSQQHGGGRNVDQALDTYFTILGSFKRSDRSLEQKMVEFIKSSYPADSLTLAKVQHRAGVANFKAADYAAARGYYEAALRGYEGKPAAASEQAACRANLGAALRELGELSAADKMLRQALKEQEALSKPDPSGRGCCVYHLALCLEKEHSLPEAESFARDSVAAYAIAARDKPAPAVFVKDAESLYERLLIQNGLTPAAAQARVKKVAEDARMPASNSGTAK